MDILLLISTILIIATLPLIIKKYRAQRTSAPAKEKNVKSTAMFSGYYVELRAFYVNMFDAVPCIHYIEDIDGNKALEHVLDQYGGLITGVYKRNYFNWKEEKTIAGVNLVVLKNEVVIEIGTDYTEICYPNALQPEIDALNTVLVSYKLPEKEDDFEINIISFIQNEGLSLKRMEIKPTLLEVNRYYNDDFAPVDKLIKERLLKENDKGIVLLHGLPGTGKTTYLRHLIGEMKKKVLFVSPSVASNLMNPEFVDLLIDNPNSILVIEDAENILMDRRYNAHSSVSNLLNLSDGLLSDCLNVQIICTFNSAINTVDNALLRKGRLIAQYEFGKLSIEKAQQLSEHLALQQLISQPMTLAEITNPGKAETTAQEPAPAIGFRRAVLMEC